MTQERVRGTGPVGPRSQSTASTARSLGPKSAGPSPKKATNKRITNNLVALSSVAILSVYGIGYARTQSAADLMANQGGATGTPPGSSAAVPAATVPSAKARQTTPVAPTATPIPIPSDDSQQSDGAVGQIGQDVPPLPTATAAVEATSTTGATPSENVATAPTLTPVAPVAKPTTPRATPTTPPATPTAKPNVRTLRDGSYVGNGFSRHGGIEATVVISGGKIVSANVTNCGTRYPCRLVTPLVSEVVSSQTAPIDMISGATDSSYAYHDAVVKALSQAT